MESLEILKAKNPDSENEQTAVNSSPLLRQVLVSSGPWVITICTGMIAGYSATLIPQIEREDSTITVTTEQSSWIASMAALSMIFGSALSGIIMEKLGRKTVLIIAALTCIIAWIIMGAAANVEMIMIGRFIKGICAGLTVGTSSIYVAETSDPKYRPFLLGPLCLSTSFGTLVTHLMGTFLTWQLVAYLSTIAPIVCVVLLMFVPESPMWLANKGQFKKSKEAFFWCRGNSAQAIDEFNAMIEKQTNVAMDKFTWSSCNKREFWKPLIIVIVYFVTTQFSGVNAMVFYSVSMMQDTVGKGMDEYVAMGIIDSIRLLASALSCILTKRYGRRPLTNFGWLGTSISLLVLSLFLYLSMAYPHIQRYTGIPLAAMIAYIFINTASVYAIACVIIGEVFPLSFKGLGSSIATSVNFITMFFVIKTHPVMNLYLQPAGTFLLYSLSTAAGGIFLYFFLPETKGKTLQQIEEQFKKKQKELTNESIF